jgi:hypothetical protein
MVDYLNSLRTQEHGANPSFVHENRKVFLDRLRIAASWFPNDEALHVRTRLDDLVDHLSEVSAHCDLIFLTGDAGDGKTALCAQVARHLGFSDELVDITDVNGWTIVKDASEIQPEHLEDLLAKRLSGIGPKVLVAINEGRLRRMMRPPDNGEPGLAAKARPNLWRDIIEPALEAWIDDQAAQLLDHRMRVERVMVLNFRNRFHVPAVVPRLLEIWTRAEYWEISSACGTCIANQRCPILANAQALRCPAVQNNISEVLQSAHFSGQRLPFRRLQAVLALSVTGGLKCRDLKAGGALAEDQANPLELLQYRYYEALFRTDDSGPVKVAPEAINRSLAPSDPGRSSDPTFDREVGYAAGPTPDVETPIKLRGTALPEFEQEAIRYIRRSYSTEGSGLTDRLARLTEALRRWVGLSVATPGSNPPEPWRKALRYLRDYAQGGAGDDLRRAVTAAINRYHFLPARKEDSITNRQIAAAAFRDPARLALELNLGVEFQTDLSRGPVIHEFVKPWLESAASEIYFTACPKGQSASECKPARLHLNSRLVETLLGTQSGFTYIGALGAYRMDLARFHSRLLALARESGSDPKVLLRVDDKIYRAACEGGNGISPAQLRFEGEA